MIKQGAKLVETAEDILLELRLDHLKNNAGLPASASASVVSNSSSSTSSSLLKEMGYDPIHPDVLAQRCNIESGELSTQLLMLELEGQVEILAGGLYRRIS